VKYERHISVGEIHPCTPRHVLDLSSHGKGHENDKCTIVQMFGVRSFIVQEMCCSPAICTVFFQFQQAALETWKLKTPIYMMFPITLWR